MGGNQSTPGPSAATPFAATVNANASGQIIGGGALTGANLQRMKAAAEEKAAAAAAATVSQNGKGRRSRSRSRRRSQKQRKQQQKQRKNRRSSRKQ